MFTFIHIIHMSHFSHKYFAHILIFIHIFMQYSSQKLLHTYIHYFYYFCAIVNTEILCVIVLYPLRRYWSKCFAFDGVTCQNSSSSVESLVKVLRAFFVFSVFICDNRKNKNIDKRQRKNTKKKDTNQSEQHTNQR